MATINNSVDGVALTVGIPIPPTAGITIMTNIVDTTQGINTNIVVSSNASSHRNAGYIEFYVGTQLVYIPYWINH